MFYVISVYFRKLNQTQRISHRLHAFVYVCSRRHRESSSLILTIKLSLFKRNIFHVKLGGPSPDPTPFTKQQISTGKPIPADCCTLPQNAVRIFVLTLCKTMSQLHLTSGLVEMFNSITIITCYWWYGVELCSAVMTNDDVEAIFGNMWWTKWQT